VNLEQPPFDGTTFSQTPRPVREYLESVVKVAAAQKSYIEALEKEVGLTRRRIAELASRAVRVQRTPKLAVFVSDLPRAREAKLAFGLRRAGWRIVLLHRENPTFDSSIDFEESIRYSNPWEALTLAVGYTPVVYHVFSNWNFEVAALFVRCRPGKIVFDDYDVMAGMTKEEFVHRTYPGQLEAERFCLENADGLCCRSLETQYAKRMLHYRFKGLRIFFPEYCWGFNNHPVQRSEGDRPLHFCYIGNLGAPGKVGGYHCELVRMIRNALNGKFLYHIYPSSSVLLEAYQKLIQEEDLTEVVKIHRPLENSQLLEALREFDVGIHIGNLGEKDAVTDAYVLDRKRAYSMSNKVFDYLDSGLLVLIGDQRLQRALLRRVGCLIGDAFADQPAGMGGLLSGLREELGRRVAPELSCLHIEKHVSRLEQFYLRL
jgi:hypothetical protein